jgi:enolase
VAKIRQLDALEILDSRGRPTIQVSCQLAGGSQGTVQVPSGASTGKAEARELRDGDAKRHRGLGCRRACENVNATIAAAVVNRQLDAQRELDELLITLDGTPNKSHLGANATLGVSLAFARAMAVEKGVALYQHFADLIEAPLSSLPRLTVNLFSGGRHAGSQVAIQDVLVVPNSATSIEQGLADVCSVYAAAAELAHDQYGMRLLTADEGGLAPPFPGIEAMFRDTVTAIATAKLLPDRDVSLAIDVAASQFYTDGAYQLDRRPLNSDEMIDEICRWVDAFSIVSVEDGLAEDDWENWPKLRSRLSPRSLVVGDDLLCTNDERIKRAIDLKACDTLLLKVNQIGTLTEAAAALRTARSANWRVTISARSGETEDNWLADLAVGWTADQIKVGSVTQSERLAKYNRLLAIEAETGLPVVAWP